MQVAVNSQIKRGTPQSTGSWLSRTRDTLFEPTKFADRALMLICGIGAGSAISIALLQGFALTLLLYWLGFLLANRSEAAKESLAMLRSSASIRYLAVPFSYWALICVLSSLSGIDPLNSLFYILQASLYLLLPFCVASAISYNPSSDEELLSRLRAALLALVLGHSAACLLRAISLITEHALTFGTPGPVTQSGQLVLVIPALLALSRLSRNFASIKTSSYLSATAGIILLLSLVWIPGACLNLVTPIVYRTIGLVLLAALFRRHLWEAWQQLRSFTSFKAPTSESIIILGATLMAAALLINLKRGPWLAIFVQAIIFGALFSRKAILFVLALVLVAATTITPVRSRASAFVDDFTIFGGRQTMWAMGAELSQRYPLGLGPHNARIMRELDSSLPESHRHMHNNFLNVAVESGWLGVAIFCWLFYRIIALGFRGTANRPALPCGSSPYRALAYLMGISILGWQVAGLVEYNFGDGEVRIPALMIVGLLLAAVIRLEQDPTPNESY